MTARRGWAGEDCARSQSPSSSSFVAEFMRSISCLDILGRRTGAQTKCNVAHLKGPHVYSILKKRSHISTPCQVPIPLDVISPSDPGTLRRRSSRTHFAFIRPRAVVLWHLQARHQTGTAIHAPARLTR